MESVRLNKYLAQCGICSRRDGDRLIEEGRVKVNGVTASMGMKIAAGDLVEVEGKRVKGPEEKVVLAFYKPKGIVCSEKDSHGEKIIRDVVSYPVRVTYAGRLDKDSEGLLLLSNDGEMIHQLMKGSFCHEKEYIVKVAGSIDNSFIGKMQEGIYLEELGVMTRKCCVKQLDSNSFSIVLTQGLNRQIRRMCEYFGLKVIYLKRIRVANIGIEDMKPGDIREIRGKELEQLYKIIGMEKSNG